jgi:hypothetical protein
MPKQTSEPGPGRSTSENAFDELRKKIALQNERAQKVARELRATRDRARARQRVQQDDEWTRPRAHTD